VPATATTERAPLATLLAAQRRWRVCGAVLSCGVALAVVAQAAALALAVDAAVSRGEFPATWVWLMAITAIVLRYLLAGAREACARRAASETRARLRRRLRRRIHALGPPGLARTGGGAVWAVRYQSQVEALSAWPERYAPARDAAFIVPMAVLVAVASQDAISALLLAVSAPLILAFTVLTGLGGARIQARQQHDQQRLDAHFLDRLRALDLLRRSGALARSVSEVFAAADRHRVLSMRVLRVAFVSSAVMELFSAIAIGMVAIHVGFALLGSTSGGEPGITLLAGLFVLLLAPEFFLPLRAFAQTWHDRAGALAASRSLGGLLDGPRASLPAAAAKPADKLLLDARELSAAPAPDVPPVVCGATLRLLPREIVALTGASGVGKSTLLAVCAGFVAPHGGMLARVPEIAWLGQRGHLFYGSVRDNLQMAAPAADDVQLADALALAGLPADDAALPDGLDTRVGEGRRGLSGGQAQRVGLARVWLSGARLWLLDEPTCGLDDETAAALWGRLIDLAGRRGAAVLVATHDARAIARADRVLELAGGRLREVVDASH
jgi:ATP-binding cassette subfamily C protein CydD